MGRSFFYTDTEVKVPKTGRKAAQMRIKLAELSHKSEVAVNDLHRVTKLVEADMSMGVVAPRKGNEGRAASSVEPSPQCQGGDSSQPVATSSVDKLGRSGVSATKEVRLNDIIRTIIDVSLRYIGETVT